MEPFKKPTLPSRTQASANTGVLKTVNKLYNLQNELPYKKPENDTNSVVNKIKNLWVESFPQDLIALKQIHDYLQTEGLFVTPEKSEPLKFKVGNVEDGVLLHKYTPKEAMRTYKAYLTILYDINNIIWTDVSKPDSIIQDKKSKDLIMLLQMKYHLWWEYKKPLFAYPDVLKLILPEQENFKFKTIFVTVMGYKDGIFIIVLPNGTPIFVDHRLVFAIYVNYADFATIEQEDYESD